MSNVPLGRVSERASRGRDSQPQHPTDLNTVDVHLAPGTQAAVARRSEVPQTADAHLPPLRIVGTEHPLRTEREAIAKLEKIDRPTPEQATELARLKVEHAEAVRKAARFSRANERELLSLEEGSPEERNKAREQIKDRMEVRKELAGELRQEREATIKRLIATAPDIDKPGSFGGTNAGGFATQGLIYRQLAATMNKPMTQLNGKTPTEAGFVLIPLPAGGAADAIGGDFVLVNKNTGKYLPLDASQRDKSRDGLPELRNNVITSDPHNPAYGQEGTAEYQERRAQDIARQFGDIIGKVQKSPLNILDTPIQAGEPQQSARETARQIDQSMKDMTALAKELRSSGDAQAANALENYSKDCNRAKRYHDWRAAEESPRSPAERPSQPREAEPKKGDETRATEGENQLTKEQIAESKKLAEWLHANNCRLDKNPEEARAAVELYKEMEGRKEAQELCDRYLAEVDKPANKPFAAQVEGVVAGQISNLENQNDGQARENSSRPAPDHPKIEPTTPGYDVTSNGVRETTRDSITGKVKELTAEDRADLLKEHYELKRNKNRTPDEERRYEALTEYHRLAQDPVAAKRFGEHLSKVSERGGKTAGAAILMLAVMRWYNERHPRGEDPRVRASVSSDQ